MFRRFALTTADRQAGVRLRPYQERLVDAVIDDIRRETPEVVVAAAPGAGKTEMAFAVIRRALAQGLATRVLVLPHGTTVLWKQFVDRATAELGAAMVYAHGASRARRSGSMAARALAESTAPVMIALPQALHRRDNLPTCDLVIVDEAHEFYEAKMAKKVIARVGARSIVLLTGTPSKFIARQLPLHAISLHEIMTECPEAYCDPAIDLVHSEFLISYDRYNSKGETRTDVSFRKKQTATTLDGLLTKMVEHLPRRRGRSAADWRDAIRAMGKTIVACRSLTLARQVAAYFKRRGVVAGLSTHEDDAGSEEIERFKTDRKMPLLVVVRRGVLGFNFPELMNLVDMTMTINIDRIFQMLARVVRPHPTLRRATKLFVKVVPSGIMEGYTKDVMNAALQLGRKETFEAYDGRNLDSVVIPRLREDASPAGTGQNGDLRKPRKPPRLKFRFRLMDFFEVVNGMDDEFSHYARTTIAAARRVVMQRSPHGYWKGAKCTVAGCERQVRFAGLCRYHAHQKSSGEELTPIPQRGLFNPCSFAGCGRRRSSYGLCESHAKQRRKGQDLREIAVTKGTSPCSFLGCQNKASCRGLCNGHEYQRVNHGYLRTLKPRRSARRATISSVERIVRLVNAGLSQRDIADKLNLSQATVSYHVNKRGICAPRKTPTEAIQLAMRMRSDGCTLGDICAQTRMSLSCASRYCRGISRRSARTVESGPAAQ